MRTTDDPMPDKWRPLGPAVPRAPAPPAPEPKPQGPYGIVTGPDGKIRTTKEPPA